jgi:hypothetical protein
MLDEYKTSDQCWVKAVNEACHVSNRLYLHKILKKTPYEHLTGNKINVSYFRVFGSKCYVLQKRSNSSKFAPKVYEGLLLGYDSNSHAYHIFTKVVLKPYVMRCLMRLMAHKWSNMILML